MCTPSAPQAQPAPPPPPTQADDSVRASRARFLLRNAGRFGISSSILTGPRGSQSGSLLNQPVGNTGTLGGGLGVTGLGPGLGGN